MEEKQCFNMLTPDCHAGPERSTLIKYCSRFVEIFEALRRHLKHLRTHHLADYLPSDDDRVTVHYTSQFYNETHSRRNVRVERSELRGDLAGLSACAA